MKNWRRSQWIENKSKGVFRDNQFSQKDNPKGLNTLFVKLSTLTCEKRCKFAKFSILNLKISNSTSMNKFKTKLNK